MMSDSITEDFWYQLVVNDEPIGYIARREFVADALNDLTTRFEKDHIGSRYRFDVRKLCSTNIIIC